MNTGDDFLGLILCLPQVSLVLLFSSLADDTLLLQPIINLSSQTLYYWHRHSVMMPIVWHVAAQATY